MAVMARDLEAAAGEAGEATAVAAQTVVAVAAAM
jgi:hypothetical protein